MCSRTNPWSEIQILNGIYYIKGVLSVIVGLCGLMGNAATITVLRMPTFKETFHKLLICLSCFDSIFIGKHFFLSVTIYSVSQLQMLIIRFEKKRWLKYDFPSFLADGPVWTKLFNGTFVSLKWISFWKSAVSRHQNIFFLIFQ